MRNKTARYLLRRRSISQASYSLEVPQEAADVVESPGGHLDTLQRLADPSVVRETEIPVRDGDDAAELVGP